MANNVEGILPKGTTYNLDRDRIFTDIDPATGEWKSKVYPAGGEVKILKHKLKREGAYRYVDYVVEMPDGMVAEEGSIRVHRILGLPSIKIKKK